MLDPNKAHAIETDDALNSLNLWDLGFHKKANGQGWRASTAEGIAERILY